MNTFLWIAFILVVLYVLGRYQQGKSTKPSTLPPVVPDGDSPEQDESPQIRSEIQAEVARHSAAVKVLQALSRIDGTTSEAERRLIFMFLIRRGAQLSEQRHWRLFYGHVAGEFGRAINLKDFESLLRNFQFEDKAYRLDAYATGQAIVGVGGTPKKREQEALSLMASVALMDS